MRTFTPCKIDNAFIITISHLGQSDYFFNFPALLSSALNYKLKILCFLTDAKERDMLIDARNSY